MAGLPVCLVAPGDNTGISHPGPLSRIMLVGIVENQYGKANMAAA